MGEATAHPSMKNDNFFDGSASLDPSYMDIEYGIPTGMAPGRLVFFYGGYV